MILLLNIGLASEAFGNIRPQDAICTAIQLGIEILAFKVLESDTEPTVVARVDIPMVTLLTEKRPVYNLARLLGQDCIAVYSETERTGCLVGPDAKAWGVFNPEFFFLLDGTRLAQPVAAAA